MLTFFLYFWNYVLWANKKLLRREWDLLGFLPFWRVSISASSFFRTAHELLLLFLHITHSPFTTAASLIAIFSCYLPLFFASLERTLYTWLSAYLFCAPGLYLFFSLPSNMLLVDTLFSFSIHPFCHCCFFFTSWGLIFGLRVSGFVCFTPIIIWLTLNLSNNTDNGTENFDLVSYSSPLVVDSLKRSSAFLFGYGSLLIHHRTIYTYL